MVLHHQIFFHNFSIFSVDFVDYPPQPSAIALNIIALPTSVTLSGVNSTSFYYSHI
jgi:hypothetical protein